MADTAGRIEQIQTEMEMLAVDAVVLRLAENIVLATRWYVQMPGLALVVVGRSGGATLLVPEYEAAEAAETWSGDIRTFPAIRNDGPAPGAEIERHLRDLAAEHDAVGGVVGFEGSFESVAPGSIHGEPNAVALPTRALLERAFSAERLHDFTEPLEAMRAIKTDEEIELIRRTNEIAVFGLEAFKEHSVPGKTEVEVMAAVEYAIATRGHGYKGARWVRGFCTIFSGPDLAEGWKYWRARTRPIEQDDVVMLELGTVADGYWSDHTRTVVAGTASPRLQEAYDAMRAAASAGFAAAKPGVAGGEVDRVSRETCAAAGFTQFPHHTGHGTGFRYHESRPQLVPAGTDVLSAGNVIITEPGIYGTELNGGVRHEDDAVVTAGGAVVLATTDYPLDLA
ncbi:MAG TPA: Xaa-Pro peptidase family protein [Gaiellaceae bacterium]|nr:Xaa-Pro peptidase family protein [Gaiellaceae bacterium]